MDETTRVSYSEIVKKLKTKNWVREEAYVKLPSEEEDRDENSPLTMFSYLVCSVKDKFFYLYHEKVDVTKESGNGSIVFGINKEKITLVIQDKEDRDRELLVDSPELLGFYLTSLDIPELEDLYLHASGLMRCLRIVKKKNNEKFNS